MHLRAVLVGFVVGGFASQAVAQAPIPPAQPQAAVTGQDQQLLSGAQLDALVAPIALYPDGLLAQVLMASTYPLEVVQADRWVAANKKIKGEQLKAAIDKESWDASVKSLVATPSVLEMMSKNLDWTQKLGDAVLAQQSDVMDGVQRMRARAYEARKLSSSSQQKVTVQQDSKKQTILIEPAAPDTVYVPYYDPAVVYGSWPYPAYPPYYFPAPGYIATGVVATGIAFGAGYALGRWTSGGYWGGNVNWVGGDINIDRNRVTHWEHDVRHRHGVQYRNDAVRQKFSNGSLRAGSEGRIDFRGRNGGQGLQPGGSPGGAGPGGAGRLDQRPGDRPGPGARPDRPNVDRERGSVPRAAAQPRRPAPGGGRPGPARDNAFSMQSGRAVSLQSQRGHASMSRGPAGRMGHGGAQMPRGGGRAGGGGRRSDIQLENRVALLGWTSNGPGIYRFAYNDPRITDVGVIAREPKSLAPQAAHRTPDCYLRVNYRVSDVPFQTPDQWKASGSWIPTGAMSGPSKTAELDFVSERRSVTP